MLLKHTKKEKMKEKIVPIFDIEWMKGHPFCIANKCKLMSIKHLVCYAYHDLK